MISNFNCDLEYALEGKGIFSMYDFERIEPPTSLIDSTFAKICEIYLELFKNNWKFLKYDVLPRNAIVDVENIALNSILDEIVFDLESDTDRSMFGEYADNSFIITSGDLNITVEFGKAEFSESFDSYSISDVTFNISSGGFEESIKVANTSDWGRMTAIIQDLD